MRGGVIHPWDLGGGGILWIYRGWEGCTLVINDMRIIKDWSVDKGWHSKPCKSLNTQIVAPVKKHIFRIKGVLKNWGIFFSFLNDTQHCFPKKYIYKKIPDCKHMTLSVYCDSLPSGTFPICNSNWVIPNRLFPKLGSLFRIFSNISKQTFTLLRITKKTIGW